jgi:broad specificity phosphatase PhoE
VSPPLPPWTEWLLTRVPIDRPVVLLLRHAERPSIPDGETGHDLALTELGRRQAFALGQRLGAHLASLHTSPVRRCRETANAIVAGTGSDILLHEDRRLGDPGVFVLDEVRAWGNWQRLGHQGVIEHLVSRQDILPGMADPAVAARELLKYMMAHARGSLGGLHLFVTHDIIQVATVARLLGEQLDVSRWPGYLEGALFWKDEGTIWCAYHGREAVTR